MGRRSTTGGVRPKGDRIQVQFVWRGREYRPTLNLKPTESNLKHARRLREQIVKAIEVGSFEFAAYFPDYKFIDQHRAPAQVNAFDDVKDKFIAWVKTRQKHSSALSLQRKLTSFWSPAFGQRDIRSIKYAELSDHVAKRSWGSTKTHNNYVSGLREMFAYAMDHEYVAENPALKLKMLKVQASDPHPYTIAEAMALIAQAQKTHGRHDAIYWSIAFLLGMRPGEQISLKWSDWNKITGRLTVQRMRTEGEDSESTKTNYSRHVDLPLAAVVLLNELRALTAFSGWMFVDQGKQIDRSTVMRDRWALLHKLAGVDYREPYQCRHSSVSWKLMLGQNILKVAKNHGHSVQTMLKTYAHWVEAECEEAELQRIRQFHGFDSGSAAERRSQ